ncbi:MAG: phenylacetate--CoA ligase family protein [Firmicutes bacterium]|nr:phenylacetate--CoA ligase family protein [Bacillota bacterium]
MDFIKPLIEHAVYPLMEAKNGNCIRKYLTELKISETYTKGQLSQIQWEKLTSLLCESVLYVPAYQHLGLLEQDIIKDPFAALQKIPVLTKKQYQQDSESYVNTKRDRSTFITNKSGGSTGEPVVFYMDRYTVEHYEAARWRGMSWWGITPGSRSVMIWGNPIELSANQAESYRKKDKYLKNRITISAYQLSPDRLSEYVRTINKYKQEYNYGYATAIYAFASLMEQAGLRLSIKLKVVVSTSETLHEYQRELIQRVFSCPCVNEYGARDAGILGFEAPDRKIHATMENAIIELLDPVTFQPVKDGESGLICVTDLNNFVQPRLRYILGDLATYDPQASPTSLPPEEGYAEGYSNALPVLQSLDGRQDALLIAADGTLVHGNFVSQLTRKYPDILKFQVFQHTQTTATAKVVLRKTEDAAADAASAEATFSAYKADLEALLPGVTFTMERVDEILPSKSGKYRYTIREFEH